MPRLHCWCVARIGYHSGPRRSLSRHQNGTNRFFILFSTDRHLFARRGDELLGLSCWYVISWLRPPRISSVTDVGLHAGSYTSSQASPSCDRCDAGRYLSDLATDPLLHDSPDDCSQCSPGMQPWSRLVESRGEQLNTITNGSCLPRAIQFYRA